MPDTATALSGFSIKIDGADASDDLMHDLLTVTVDNSLHLPDVATIVLHDPTLRWIDDNGLALGKSLKLTAGVERDNQPVFDGEIVELEPAFSGSTHHVTVRAYDRLHRLNRGRHVRSYQNVSDADLVRRIAQDLGLQSEVGETSRVHDYVLQSNQTNLEFLSGRAASLGYLLWVQGSTLHCQPPRTGGNTIALEWGVGLREFRPRMTTIDQVNSVTVRGWDPQQRQNIVGQAQNGNGSPDVGERQHGGDVARSAFDLPAEALITNRPIRSQALADQIAQAVADRRGQRFIEAEGVCGGNPEIVAGASIRVSAVGDRFSGTYFVTSSTHEYAASEGYSTRFTVSGQDPVTLLTLLHPDPDTSRPRGLAIGIVTDNNDPLGQGRVKVMFPWLSSQDSSDWARVVAPGAGPQRGMEFLPEVNDEVLVGFELGDIQFAYVLGGLWNGQDAPPKPGNQIVTGGGVQQRIIRSRAGHTITLDDADGAGGVTIEDRNGNKIKLDSENNSLTIEVQGDASIRAQGNLKLEASGQLEIQGAAGVKVESQANVDVQGTIVNLN